ncbi:hypothetical protein [Thermoflavimicrobium daqui]|jgi:hypothetical protein|uniref:Uncharacterized protein n=1 Tax=Thermoflavimicrobium daqui TaxID=2137476 RepID=A0A364K625_9BACL|nr:hypothetical protein [Thermoflavimicrobium daqui]RAL25662.1 hypothetical protein DL897_06175 [Thermoflavimicrobium daqui]
MGWKQRKLKKRLLSFETIFRKHAEICPHCRALNVWPLGEAMPKTCRRCDQTMSENEQEEERTIYFSLSRNQREILHH